MSRFVEYSELGSPSVLHVVDVPEPHAGPGEVRVRVHAAGLNPIDGKIRSGFATRNAPTLPAGTGADFAGVVDEVGDGVTTFAVGDAVLGGARNRAIADHIVIDADLLTAKPGSVPFVVAGALDIAGRTAWNSVHSFDFGPDDTVFVSAAAGGVGFIASQLVLATGATVVGSASPDNHEVLRAIGVIPVRYGDTLVEELRDVAPDGYTAALDNHGDASVEAALAVGVPADRINSIAAYHSIASRGIRSVGGGPADPVLLATIVGKVADGTLRVLVDSTWSIDQVVKAFERLEAGHVTGKVVVTIDE